MSKSNPITYADWHAIYHRELRAMGFAAMTYHGLRFSKAPQNIREWLGIRSVWRNYERLRRIQDRLDKCRERNCPTWIEHMAGLVLGEGK